MLANITTINNLVRRADEGIYYLITNSAKPLASPLQIITYMNKALDAATSLGRLDDQNLIDLFSDEIAEIYFADNDKSRLLRILNTINSRVYQLWGALAEFKKSNIVNSENNKYLTANDRNILEIIQNHADIASNNELAYYPIVEIIERFNREIERFDQLRGFADENATQTTNQLMQPTDSTVKMRWTCKPAIAGFIVSELIRAGYIEPPVRRGDLNMKELARICDQIFEFRDYKPGVDGWRNNVDPTRNELNDLPRFKLKLPDLDQLA